MIILMFVDSDCANAVFLIYFWANAVIHNLQLSPGLGLHVSRAMLLMRQTALGVYVTITVI